MAYETLIGWRYLYRTPHAHRRLTLGLFLVCLGVAVLSALLWIQTSQPPPWSVFTFAVGSLSAIVFLVVNIFSIFTSVSIFGVILGVMALTIVMSVTSGFQSAFQDKVLGVNADVLVMRNISSGFSMYRDVEEIVRQVPGVVGEEPFIFADLLITRGKGEHAGIALKGVDPDRLNTVLALPRHMIEGDVAALKSHPPDEPPSVIVGKELARKLKARIGDTVNLVLPNLQMVQLQGNDSAALGSAGQTKSRKFVIRGIFYSGFDEYDRRLVYISLRDAQDFLGEGDSVSGVEMKLSDVNEARDVRRFLEQKLGEPYVVVDWKGLNANLFTALTIQKIALLVFLTLIIIVAAFNMVAALTMMVLDKQKEISILKSMGASSAGVARLFQVVGLTIGGLGTALGLSLGVIFSQVISRYGYRLDPKVYLIDRLPTKVDPLEVALVGIITMVICFVATLYPALKASNLRPVDGIRYE